MSLFAMRTHLFAATACSIVLPACGAASPAADGVSGTEAPAASPLTEAERAACSPKTKKEKDSLACLFAAYTRRAKGDLKGADEVLLYGCDHGDFDSCLDLRKKALSAGDTVRANDLFNKVGAGCGQMGDAQKEVASCLRDRTDEIIRGPGLQWAWQTPLDLRAHFGPMLMTLRDRVQKDCSEALKTFKTPDVSNVAFFKDDGVLDATFLCAADRDIGSEALGKLRSGETMQSAFTARTLRDAFVSDRLKVHLAAPAGDLEIGAFCPSVLVDSDLVADVWMVVPFRGDRVIMTVPIAEPCRSAQEIADRKFMRAQGAATFSAQLPVIDAALNKLATACDGEIASLDTKKSPLAGDAVESTKGILGFEAKCQFGYAGFSFTSPKPLEAPPVRSSETVVFAALDRTVKGEVIAELPRILELSFRKRNAVLTIAVKRP